MKLNPEIKTKLVEAFRSGSYVQGQGSLRSANDCFCAWGVIADVSGVGKWEGTGCQGDKAYTCNDVQSAYLPPLGVVSWLGMASLEGFKLTIDGRTMAIMDHNDSKDFPVTFAQLADAIEEQL